MIRTKEQVMEAYKKAFKACNGKEVNVRYEQRRFIVGQFDSRYSTNELMEMTENLRRRAMEKNGDK